MLFLHFFLFVATQRERNRSKERETGNRMKRVIRNYVSEPSLDYPADNIVYEINQIKMPESFYIHPGKIIILSFPYKLAYNICKILYAQIFYFINPFDILFIIYHPIYIYSISHKEI